jgi:16S rRNA (uracil1498-N3)-methyltransferase
MPIDRYFLDGPLEKGTLVSLEEPELRHLRVTRKHPGESVELVNGKGSLGRAEIAALGKRDATLKILEVEQKAAPSQQIILAQAIPKLPRLEYILEKGTELGVFAFWLFPGALSEKSDFSESQWERLKLIVLSALKQCERRYLPEIVLLPKLDKWEAPQGTLFYGDPRATEPLNKESGRTLIFIGPEGGFEERECAQLDELGAKGVKLHGNVLRVDTAAICALSQLY